MSILGDGKRQEKCGCYHCKRNAFSIDCLPSKFKHKRLNQIREIIKVHQCMCVVTKLSTFFFFTLIQLSEAGMNQIVWNSGDRSRSPFVVSQILLSISHFFMVGYISHNWWHFLKSDYLVVLVGNFWTVSVSQLIN